MMKTFTLILFFFSLAASSQELSCCSSVKEVEASLAGVWVQRDSEPTKKIRFKFQNGQGTMQVFTTNNGLPEKASTRMPKIKIFKTRDAFKIEHDFGVVKTYMRIKKLDSRELIIVRKDGAEQEYYRLKD